MASVADLVEEPALRRLAEPEVYELGTALAADGKVRVEEFGPVKVAAEVDGSRVELRMGNAGLGWSCTCRDARDGRFCPHAVAAGLETWRRSPKREG